MADIAVLGAGSWALGISILLHDNGHKVTIWSALPEEIELLKEKRENPKYLPGVILPEKIDLTAELSSAVKDRDCIVLAVASKFTRQTAHRLNGLIPDGQVLGAGAAQALLLHGQQMQGRMQEIIVENVNLLLVHGFLIPRMKMVLTCKYHNIFTIQSQAW